MTINYRALPLSKYDQMGLFQIPFERTKQKENHVNFFKSLPKQLTLANHLITVREQGHKMVLTVAVLQRGQKQSFYLSTVYFAWTGNKPRRVKTDRLTATDCASISPGRA